VRTIRDHRQKEGEADNIPLLYLDPGYRPQVRAWLDELQAEYFLNATPGLRDAGKPRLTAHWPWKARCC
jgi:hypothetical protein